MIELIPETHLFRKINRMILFDFICDFTASYYPTNGRSYVDLVSVFEMLLMGYLYSIKSEHRLVQEIQLNICLDETGHLLRPDYVTCKFSQLVKKRGLKKITFHGLRHSCASMLYERGQDMKKIQEWLGHSTPVTTETIYAHLNVKHKDETAWIANDCLPLELPEKMREKPIQTAWKNCFIRK